MGSIKIWNRVADGSRFELSLTSDSEGFAASARFLMDDGTEEMWEQTELVPGPKTKTVSSPRTYAVTVRVAFLAVDPIEVTIHARIVKPNGTIHDGPYDYLVSGKKGDNARATISIVTTP